MDERKREGAPGLGFAALMLTIALALIVTAATVGKYLGDVSEKSSKMVSASVPAVAPAAPATPAPAPEAAPATPPSQQPPPTTTPAP